MNKKLHLEYLLDMDRFNLKVVHLDNLPEVRPANIYTIFVQIIFAWHLPSLVSYFILPLGNQY